MPSIQIPFSGRPEHLSFQKDAPVAIHFWHITENEQQLSSLLAYDRASVNEACRHFRSAARRREWMAVRLLLAVAAGSSVRLEHTPAGCPFLSDGSRHVSISHTGDYVVLALAETGRIGVDLERRTPRAFRLRKKFLAPDEETILWKDAAVSDYTALSVEDRAVLLWSAKEAAYKKIAPAGGATLLQDIRLSMGDGCFVASCKGGQTVAVRFYVADTLVLTVCQ